MAESPDEQVTQGPTPGGASTDGASADESERTVVVDRSATPGAGEADEEGGETVVVDRHVDEKTVVVDRPSRGRAKPEAEVDDGTAVIDRSVDDDESDRTVAVVRGGADDDERTVAVDRSDKTVAVDRKRKGKQAIAPAASPAEPADVMRVLPSRRSLRLPPVEPDFGREAVPAVGPGAVDVYTPREIAPAPVAAEPLPRGEEAFRADAPSMPSVSRRSRRTGAITMLAFGGACVVSVVGLVLVALFVLRG